MYAVAKNTYNRRYCVVVRNTTDTSVFLSLLYEGFLTNSFLSDKLPLDIDNQLIYTQPKNTLCYDSLSKQFWGMYFLQKLPTNIPYVDLPTDDKIKRLPGFDDHGHRLVRVGNMTGIYFNNKYHKYDPIKSVCLLDPERFSYTFRGHQETTCMDYIKLPGDTCTFFGAMLDSNRLMAGIFNGKGWEYETYRLKTRVFFYLFSHFGKFHILTQEGKIYRISKRRLKKIKNIPYKLSEGTLLVDKDHQSLYFLPNFQSSDLRDHTYQELMKLAIKIF